MIDKLTFAGALASIALLAQGPPMRGMHEGPMGFGGPGMGPVVTGVPYSGTEVVQTQQTLADGNRINRQDNNKVSRDSQGRTRMERTMPAAPDVAAQSTRTEILIFDPVAGYMFHLDPQKQTYSQMAIKQHLAPAAGSYAVRAHHAGNAGQMETLPAQAINGVTATGTRHTQTIPAGAIGNTAAIDVVRERWISQDLKVPVMIKTSDPRFGTTTMQLTNVVRSEPDAALFQIPAGYTLQAGPAGHGPGGRAHGHGPASQE